MADAEARGLAELLAKVPGCPVEKLAATCAKALLIKAVDRSLDPQFVKSLETFQLGRQALQLAYDVLRQAFELPPDTDEPGAALLETAASPDFSDAAREAVLAEIMVGLIEKAAGEGDARKVSSWKRVQDTVSHSSEIGRRAMAAADHTIFRRYAKRPVPRSSVNGVLRPIRRFVASRRRRAASSTAAKAANGDPPGDGDRGGRLRGKEAALDTDTRKHNADPIPQIAAEDNNNDEPLIRELWAGTLADLEPLVLLLRDPGRPWESIAITLSHAKSMPTRGKA